MKNNVISVTFKNKLNTYKVLSEIKNNFVNKKLYNS